MFNYGKSTCFHGKIHGFKDLDPLWPSRSSRLHRPKKRATTDGTHEMVKHIFFKNIYENIKTMAKQNIKNTYSYSSICMEHKHKPARNKQWTTLKKMKTLWGTQWNI